MEIFAEYESDDEDVKAVYPTNNSDPTTYNCESTGNIRNKKKKLNINILPLEIQQALTQTDSNLDSDNEEEVKLSSMHSNNRIKNQISKTLGLLDLLPKPKTSTQNTITSHGTVSSNQAFQSPKKLLASLKPLSEKSSLIDDVKAQPEIISEVNKISNSLESEFKDVGGEINDVLERNISYPHEPFSISSQKQTSLFSFELPKKPNNYSLPPILNRTQSYLNQSICEPSPHTLSEDSFNAASLPIQGTTSLAYPPDTIDSSLASDYNYNQESRENRRKSKREFEQALLLGKLDVVDNIASVNQVIAVQSLGKWDSSKYQQQKEREIEINKSYNLNSGAINQPTKTQNRKHQINSLAFQAAKVELSLLESKGARSKTKHETQMCSVGVTSINATTLGRRSNIWASGKLSDFQEFELKSAQEFGDTFSNCSMENILHELGLDDVTTEALQSCLDERESYTGTLTININLSTIESLFIAIKNDGRSTRAGNSGNETISTTMGSRDVAALKKITLYLMCFIFQCSDPTILCWAARCLIELCGITGSAAYGILSLNSLTSIASVLSKLSREELKIRHGKSVLSSTASILSNQIIDDIPQDDESSDDHDIDEDYDDDSGHDSAPLSTRIGSLSPRAPVNVALSLPLLKSLIADFNNKIFLFKQCPEDHPLELSIEGLIGIAFLSAMKPKFNDLDIIPVIFTYGSMSEKTMMLTFRSLIPAATVTGRDQRILDSFKAKVACHKMSVKIVQYFTKEMPGILKKFLKGKHAFRSSLNMSTRSGSSHTPLTAQSIVSTSTTGSVVTPNDDIHTFTTSANRSEITNTSALSNASANSSALVKTAKSFPVPFACLLGLMQRLVLCVPDRAPTRTIAVDSIFALLSTMFDIVNNMTAANGAGLCLDALSHFMSFLIKLSQCNKTGYRAFSLDILTSILGSEWIWTPSDYYTALGLTPHPKRSSACDINYFDPKFLLTTLIDRCYDIAPTVRIRALSTLCGLFETLSASSPPSKCELLLDSAMGTLTIENEHFISSTHDRNDLEDIDEHEYENKNGINEGNLKPRRSASSSYQKSIFDIFRESCDDEKPLVRSKSVQALGSALTLNWPKYIYVITNPLGILAQTPFRRGTACTSLGAVTPSTVDPRNSPQSYRIEYVTMFVSEEDLQTLVDKCDDSSLAVRKQAVIALSDLTKTRPADTSIHDAWIHAVLPMITDPESSVQARVAASVQDLILDGILTWADDYNSKLQKSPKPQKSGSFGSDFTQLGLNSHVPTPSVDMATSSAWLLLNKIASSGQTGMLKSCTSALMKAGAICIGNVSAGSQSKSTLKHIIDSAKLACCLGLNMPSIGCVSSSSTSTLNQSESAGRAVDPKSNHESLSRAGWVLLEALVAQDSALHHSQLNFDQSSADFVVRCFLHKRQTHQKQLNCNIDEDDVRMLFVLDKLALSVSHDQILEVKPILVQLLLSLMLCSNAISATVNVLYTLSKVLTKQKSNEIQRSRHRNNVSSTSSSPTSFPHCESPKKCSGRSCATAHAILSQTASKLDSVYIQAAWFDDVRNWAGRVLSTLNVVLENYTQNKAVTETSLCTEHEHCNLAPCHIDNMPPAEISDHILRHLHNPNSEEMQRLVKSAVFTLGEISMLGFSMEEEEPTVTVAGTENGPSSITSATSAQQGRKKGAGRTSSRHTNQPHIAAANKYTGEYALPVYTISEKSKTFKLICPDAMVTTLQLLMGYRLPFKPDPANPSGRQIVGDLISPDIRAYTFITMGKFCLRDKLLAQNLVNVFLRELNPTLGQDAQQLQELASRRASTSSSGLTSPDSFLTASTAAASFVAVRSNALLVLGDLCVRYTHLVDRHVGMMAQCLQDESVVVRKHAIILLTQLLLQDYLKWRGLLLFRFLATAADPDRDTSEFAKSVLQKTILSKHPDFFCQHFSEAVVVYNQWTEHPTYQAAQASGSEGDSCAVTLDGVNLHGQQKKKARFQLYAFMAEGFSEEQKIHVTAKIVDEVLSYTIDSNTVGAPKVPPVNHLHFSAKHGHSRQIGSHGHYPTFHPYEDALEDAFLILQSPLLKIGKKGGADTSDDDFQAAEEADEGVKNSKAAVAKAKSIVLKKLSRQHLVSHVLPVVMSLKHVLESHKSSLQGSIMELLVSLVKSNKAEVDQVLANDPCLKSEIEYDVRIFERNKEREQARRHVLSHAQGRTTVTFDSHDFSANGHASHGPHSSTTTEKQHAGLSLNQPSALRIIQPSLRKTATTQSRYSYSSQSAHKATGADIDRDDMVERLIGSSQALDKDRDGDHDRDEDRDGIQRGRGRDRHGENSLPTSPGERPADTVLRRRSWGVTVSGLVNTLGGDVAIGDRDGDDPFCVVSSQYDLGIVATAGASATTKSSSPFSSRAKRTNKRLNTIPDERKEKSIAAKSVGLSIVATVGPGKAPVPRSQQPSRCAVQSNPPSSTLVRNLEGRKKRAFAAANSNSLGTLGDLSSRPFVSTAVSRRDHAQKLSLQLPSEPETKRSKLRKQP